MGTAQKNPPIETVVLAAGKGTRMRSKLPKVLHTLGAEPLLGHVLTTARDLGARKTHVIYGHGGEMVPQQFPEFAVDWVLQAEQKGTGHAVMQAMPHIGSDALVLVLYGDVPLIRKATLENLLSIAASGSLGLLTAVLDDPAGYGRIVRDEQGRIQRIVEKKDASPEELAIKEINTGFLAVEAGHLGKWLNQLDNNNAQGEYYLTDIIAMAVADGVNVEAAHAEHEWEIMGVNSKLELGELERVHQMNQAKKLMAAGVTLRDASRIDIRGSLDCGEDVEIDVNVVIEGRVSLGDDVVVGANCVLKNVVIGNGTRLQANCVIEDAIIGKDCRVGPFARIRPETELHDDVHVGNFVEIKKSEVGNGSKVNHLSYVGDTTIGRKVNIGAGTITCNYDGAYKHRTIIKDNAFIGSDTQLVAPVTVGEGATIGAGTTLTKDAPAGTLTLGRSKQKSVEGWQRPVKKEKS